MIALGVTAVVMAVAIPGFQLAPVVLGGARSSRDHPVARDISTPAEGKKVAMNGEIDPTGRRTAALDTFLATKIQEGFDIETHTDTHAIVVAPRSLARRVGRGAANRYVVSVDEHGEVTMIPAEPKRS